MRSIAAVACWTVMLLACAAGAAPPNIVLIVADDLGWADLGERSDLHQTPHLKRLAEQGLSFTQAYASAPVCSPTRAAILTGKHPARLHITVWREASGEPPPYMRRKLTAPVTESNLPLEQVTLAEALCEAGYMTAHVGKWHLGGPDHYPEAHGFDLNIGGTHWGAPSTFFFPYRGLFGSSGESRYVPGLPFGQPGEYLTDRLTDEAIKVIERAGEQPFFLNLWYHNPHTPIEGKPELVEQYQQRVKPAMQHRNAHYAAMIHTLDQNVGRLMDELERRGLADHTLLIFTSDNGGFIGRYRDMPAATSNAPLRSGKGSLYEGGIRVPMIVRGPGVRRGEVSDAIVATHDLYPTILAVAGVQVDVEHAREMDGVNLLPLLRDAGATLDRAALHWHYPHYYQTTTPVSAIRRGDWKLLHYHEDDRIELYNLADDLGEQQDHAARQPQQAAELRAELEAWRQRAGAQMPSPNPEWSEPGRGRK